ncbi:membrane fusion protein, multidrug efflux system [Rhizobium sp. RU35A]|uniref:efflux RND transporter periplasmic adaptor subunit n=1 Tax=Rhizobium sp. RU35A TaxID=1907414 RepID=UPI000955A5A4|nr:efflux RND transporter periplasmic adaptor subunit [Rhizobium sp. RU35A]SIQ42004.1 membrane fusion protein, multidrug efflux system [Rhizobium sp. RU35A]
MSSSRLFLLALFGTAVTAAVLLVRFDGSADEAASSARLQPVQVVVQTLVPETVILSDELTGRVAAERRVEIRPQVGGVITQRLVHEGMAVTRGQVLFEIDTAILKAELATAEAGLQRAVSAEAHANRAAERAAALLSGNATSLEKSESARNDLLTARANLAEAKAVVERRRLDLAFATIRAPISGYVGATLADEGALANPQSDRPLAVLQAVDRVYVDLRLPAGQLEALAAADATGLGPVTIAVGKEGARPLKAGTLRFADVVVDPGTGSAPVRVAVDNPDLSLLPGMYVRARVPRARLEKALLVPADAVLRAGPGTRPEIVVVASDGQASRRSVTLGETVGERIIVTDGLAAGERVVIRGQDRIQDGLPVTPLDADATTAPQPASGNDATSAGAVQP